MSALRLAIVAASFFLAAGSSGKDADPRSPAEIGEAIYRFGILGSGQPLQAVREGGGTGAEGSTAACVNCHQRSGLGSAHPTIGGIGARELGTQIPPIAWHYLFDPVMTGHENANLPYVDGMRVHRAAYTDETLGRALREGIDADGRKLAYLMPRFAIGDEDLTALIAYLKTLDPVRVAGVDDTTLHFATIIAPDADPARRAAMLAVLEQFFAERNVRQMTPSATMHPTVKGQFARTMFMVHRQWKLHVLDLTGPPSDWRRQLEDHFQKEPVLAVISGLGRGTWAPVHDFCEHQRLACLFPNVDVPVGGPGDFFELYLSRGVLLEADLIAAHIKERARAAGLTKVHQVYRAGDSGEAAAREVADRLKDSGIALSQTVLPAQARVPAQDLGPALRAAAGAEALVLWLRKPDLSALPEPKAVPDRVYLSGLMGGLEHTTLPQAWRVRSVMAYAFDLPQKRTVRVDFPMGWFRLRKIPVVDEQMQADTYLVCGLVSEAIKEVAGTFYSPYLVEELRQMVEHRVVTGYYPRLSLAENQQFASKGGYVVRFNPKAPLGIEADGDWIVP